jgi:hypothetical protein
MRQLSVPDWSKELAGSLIMKHTLARISSQASAQGGAGAILMHIGQTDRAQRSQVGWMVAEVESW